ncbi:MAG: hypothetical protein JWM05_15 [Acidimicrobiales bacterium]|nr:hypothetical protein [Acidimicrobiales bacterium]
MRRTATVLVSLCLAATAVAGCAKKSSSSGAATSATSGTSAAGATPTTSSSSGGPPTTESSPTGDIPDNQAYVAYSPPTGGWVVKVPEGWARTDGAVTTFTDKLNSIRVEKRAQATAPTVASVTAQDLPKLAKSVTGYKAGTTTKVTRTAGPAILTTYAATSPADPVTGKVRPQAVERYVFWKGGTEVVLTLVAPKGADNVDPWKVVTSSFGWKP